MAPPQKRSKRIARKSTTSIDTGAVAQWTQDQRNSYDKAMGKEPLEGDAEPAVEEGSEKRYFVADHAIKKARGVQPALSPEQAKWVREPSAEVDEIKKWVTPVHMWVSARAIQERAAPIALRLLREYESMYGTAPAGLLGTLVRGVEEGLQCGAEITIELPTPRVGKQGARKGLKKTRTPQGT